MLMKLLAITGVVAAIAVSGGYAQAAPTTPAPTFQMMAGKSKAAISKACTVQADANNLKGKARKKFRARCIKNGGQVM